jgi:SpoVK/Ycf46/Vps4 family AAA+-type ATPase
MSTARQLIALLKTHVRGDEEEFLSIAMQVAAREARLGHSQVAEEIRKLIDTAKAKTSPSVQRQAGSVVVLQPRGELANLVSIQQPTIRLSSITLPEDTANRLRRVILEYRQQKRLRDHGLHSRRKLLFIGPPGTGKTMTATGLAGELHLPLFTILLEGVITKFMGETAAKLRVIFDSIAREHGIFLFDEFDAIGARRTHGNDVGEIRRVLNSFLQFLENDQSESLIIAATNHSDLLDRALFRRFDDVIEYRLPDEKMALTIIRSRLTQFHVTDFDWAVVASEASGLSQADLTRASDDAAKDAVLRESQAVRMPDLLSALRERKRANN